MTEVALVFTCYIVLFIHLLLLAYYGSEFIHLYKPFFNFFPTLYTTTISYHFFLILEFMEHFR